MVTQREKEKYFEDYVKKKKKARKIREGLKKSKIVAEIYNNIVNYNELDRKMARNVDYDLGEGIWI